MASKRTTARWPIGLVVTRPQRQSLHALARLLAASAVLVTSPVMGAPRSLRLSEPIRQSVCRLPEVATQFTSERDCNAALRKSNIIRADTLAPPTLLSDFGRADRAKFESFDPDRLSAGLHEGLELVLSVGWRITYASGEHLYAGPCRASRIEIAAGYALVEMDRYREAGFRCADSPPFVAIVHEGRMVGPPISGFPQIEHERSIEFPNEADIELLSVRRAGDKIYSVQALTHGLRRQLVFTAVQAAYANPTVIFVADVR